MNQEKKSIVILRDFMILEVQFFMEKTLKNSKIKKKGRNISKMVDWNLLIVLLEMHLKDI